MKNNWKTYKLGELCNITSSKRIFYNEYVSSGIPFYRSKEIILKSNLSEITNELFISKEKFYKIKEKFGVPIKDDILLTSVGTIGIPYQVKENDLFYFKDGNLTWLKDFKEFISSDYLIQWIKSNIGKDAINGITIGSTQSAITIQGLKNLELNLPPLKEQKSIASILSTIDDKIENNLAINKTLEEMAMALYKHWFVDFGPFQDGEFVESELGRIPKGWEVKRLDEIAFKRAETYKFKGKEKVVFVNTGDVLEGSFMHKNYMDVEDLPGQAKKAIYPEDILYSEIRPGNKRYAYVDFDSQDYVVSTKFMVIRNNELINNKLLYRILTRDETITEFQNIAESRSGTFPQITFDAIGHIQFALPNIDKQNEFQSIVGNWEEQQANNLKENQALTQLRDTLLPKLISGEVRLKKFQES